MRVRPQSYLLPVILLVALFLHESAFSEKRNRVYGEEENWDKKNYNENYKEIAAKGNRDITQSSKGLTENKNKKRKIYSDKNSEEYVYYIVKNGDTLYSIAKRSGISLKKLQGINNLDKNSKICKGMKLRVLSGKNSKKCINDSKNTVSSSSKPLFQWPLKKVNGYSRDGKDGVKSIGLLIKGNPGGEVIASENGVVKRVGYMRGYGKYIVLNHGKRYITVYSNLMDVDVKNGETVQKGGRIGNLSADRTLHFQIDREGKPENPLRLLPGRS